MNMLTVSAAEFQQNVGRYQDAALQAPVAVTKNGRPHTVLMSAALFEIVIKGRTARRVEDLDAETLKAIANTEMDARHNHLDSELVGWNDAAERERVVRKTEGLTAAELKAITEGEMDSRYDHLNAELDQDVSDALTSERVTSI